MRHLLFIFFICGYALSLHAQEQVVIEILLKDKGNSDPIRNAKALVSYNDVILSRNTNSSGRAYFTVDKGVDINLSFTHFKYDSITYTRSISQKTKKDTIGFSFFMNYIRQQNVDEVVVAAPGVPIKYYGSDSLHVSDFEIMRNGDLLLLTYPKRLKKGSELLVWDGKRVKNSFEVPEVAEELVRDYRGNPHLICENSVFGVHVSENKIGISNLEKNYFIKYLAPILDTNKTKLYFSNFNKDYPAFDYFSFDQLDSTYMKILEIEDDLMMELYRAEYKWVDVRTKLWAKNKEIQTGVDAEIWVGANYFTQSIYYKELYAPLFHRNDTLFVFDYYKDYLRTFDALGNKLDSIEIHHHYDKRNTGWENNLIQDRVSGQIYAIYDRNGYIYLGWVNTNTGEIKEQVQLEYRYAHNMAVFNNHVYYIYRPYESAQKKYLYKERLPYEFGAGSTPKGDLVEEIEH